MKTKNLSYLKITGYALLTLIFLFLLFNDVGAFNIIGFTMWCLLLIAELYHLQTNTKRSN